MNPIHTKFIASIKSRAKALGYSEAAVDKAIGLAVSQDLVISTGLKTLEVFAEGYLDEAVRLLQLRRKQ